MNFDNETIEIPCDNCKRKNKKTIGWIKRNNKFKCSCGTEIVVDSSQFRKEISNVEKSLKNLFK